MDVATVYVLLELGIEAEIEAASSRVESSRVKSGMPQPRGLINVALVQRLSSRSLPPHTPAVPLQPNALRL